MTATQHAPLCVPVCVRRAEELRGAIERAAAIGDLIELRFDCLEDDAELERATRELPALFRERTRPFVLTLRTREQGGRQNSDTSRRALFWAENFHPGRERADYADLELDLVEFVAGEEARRAAKLIDWDKVICSHHDFTGLPPDLEAVFERMLRTPARILKIAARARDITDCLPILRTLERELLPAGRKLIAVAMDEAGLLTRILAPSRGAFITYGALTTAQATAPGQVSAHELRALYRVQEIGERTGIMGLVGSPVSHSLSPHMHNAAFAARGLDAVYIPFEVADAPAFIRRMAHPRTRELVWNLRGLSVTAPHKTTIMPELDSIEPAARQLGAVNTVVFEGDELRGYNTDARAALAPLAGLLNLREARVAVVGAGGAARAVLWSLRESGARASVFARSTERARPAASNFDAACHALEGARFDGFDLVINTTPLGTRGERESETPVEASQLRGARAAYDLVYNPSETRFMREARAAGCEIVVGGLPMLVAQAAAQFKLWTGLDAPLEVMSAVAEKQRSEAEAGG
ncbi:MAG TPA: shikimate dehydrogenase [Pyrinomonadaceae bacterium]|nr:shikimate dehydrogenase [Pyrinomonadaceae bacterium]